MASESQPAIPVLAPGVIPPELANHPRFRIIREIGPVRHGVVYEAEDQTDQKRVALKVVSSHPLGNPEATQRIRTEIEALRRLVHPNIVAAYAALQMGELYLLVMEYVQGASLTRLVERKGPLPIEAACYFAQQAALGLQHVYEHGMVHRDLRPQNLMVVTSTGQIKILDFGLAWVTEDSKQEPPPSPLGCFTETPDYVAPEQALDARSADIRSDIYSLGCTLYFLLTGQPPFVEETPEKDVRAHVEKEPLPLDRVRPEVPLALSALVARMLAKDPQQRFSDADGSGSSPGTFS